MKSSVRTLDSLTSLRFFAAMGVVAYHSGLYLNPFSGFEIAPSLGYTGVTFFFVLSGFVLTWTYRKGDRARDFYGRRFARVWPLHMAVTLAVVAIFAATAQPQSLTGLILVTTLSQAWMPPPALHYAYNGPSWTLSCEAFFYALFPFLIAVAVSRRSRSWPAMLVLLMVLVAAGVLVISQGLAPRLGVTAEQLSGFLLYVFPAYRIGEFCLGILIALAVKDGWRPRLSVHAAIVVCGLSYIVLSVLGYSGFGGEITRMPYAVADLGMLVPFALLIAAAAVSDKDGNRTFLHSRILVDLGKSSFALYLVHEQVLRQAAAIPAANTAEGIARLCAAVVAALLIGTVAHRRLEAPVERILRRRLSPDRQHAAQSASV